MKSTCTSAEKSRKKTKKDDVVIRKYNAKAKETAKDALGDSILDRTEGSRKRNFYDGGEGNSQSSSSSSSLATPSASFRLENMFPVERTPTATSKWVKPNPPPLVRGDLLSASQIADRFPSNYPPLENLDSGDEERAAEEEDDKEVFSFH